MMDTTYRDSLYERLRQTRDEVVKGDKGHWCIDPLS
jgi:hypothetical protein